MNADFVSPFEAINCNSFFIINHGLSNCVIALLPVKHTYHLLGKIYSVFVNKH